MHQQALLQIDANLIEINKESDEIVIRFKATFQQPFRKAIASNVVILNANAVANVEARYAEMFKSQVVFPQQKVIHQDASMVAENRQTSNPKVEKIIQQPVVQANSQIEVEAPPQNNRPSQFPFSRNEQNPQQPTSTPNTSFRRNFFTTSSQSNGNPQQQYNSNTSSSNQPYNFNQSYSPPNQNSSGQGNMFIVPSSQQMPTIFGQGPARSTTSDRDSRSRNLRSSKTRIQ